MTGQARTQDQSNLCWVDDGWLPQPEQTSARVGVSGTGLKETLTGKSTTVGLVAAIGYRFVLQERRPARYLSSGPGSPAGAAVAPSPGSPARATGRSAAGRAGARLPSTTGAAARDGFADAGSPAARLRGARADARVGGSVWVGGGAAAVGCTRVGGGGAGRSAASASNSARRAGERRTIFSATRRRSSGERVVRRRSRSLTMTA